MTGATESVTSGTTSTSGLPTAAGGRDPRFDLLRGTLVLLMIFGHLGWRRMETHFHLGFVTVAEGFFLISGATLGMVERRRWRRRRAVGQPTSTNGEFRKLIRRGLWLYAANLVGVAIARMLEGSRPFPGDYFDRYWGPMPELERWLSFDQPSVLNVLPRYAVFLLLAPLAVLLLRRGRAWLLAAASVAVWLVGWATQDLLLLPLFETARAPYPALAWQLIFFGGMAVGWRAVPRDDKDSSPALSRWLTLSAFAGMVAMIVLEANQQWFDAVALELWTARSWLGPLRLLNLVFAAAVVWQAVSRWAPAVVRWCGRLVLPFGRSALQAFLLHMPLVWLLLAVPLLDAAEGLRKLIAVAAILALLPLLRLGWVRRWLRP